MHVSKGRSLGRVVPLTGSQLFPLLAMLAWPPHMSTQVLVLASHQVERSVELTWLTASEQHGMGVAKVELVWADAKPAKAEAATTRVE
jgi:hypothetical protein